MYYTYRFNPFTRYYEVIENIPELDCYRVIRKCNNETEAKNWCKVYWASYERLAKEFESYN